MAPCGVCGIPTTGPTSDYPVLSRLIETAAGRRTEPVADGASLALPTCSDCLGIQATAGAIIAAHPGLVRHLGTVATWQTTTALYALSALGHTLPGPDIAPDRLGALVRRLAAPGALMAFSRRFSPMWLADASPNHSARARWSAVPVDALTACRAAALDWFGDGRPARSIPHPSGGRCDWCGTSESWRRRPSEAWFGSLCRACAAVCDGGGSSYDAMWQAIDADQAIRRRVPYRPDLTGVVPWSQRGGGDGTPWSHLGGVEAVRERVANLLSGA